MSRNRAYRRAQRERKINNYFKRRLRNRYWKPSPHLYHAYNLDNQEDFLEFLALDDRYLQPGSGIRIYLEGKGFLNPRTYTHPYRDVEVPYLIIPYDDYESRKLLMKEATQWAETPAACHRVCCRNPRRFYKAKTLQEYKNYHKAKEGFRELGMDLPRMGKKRWYY